MSKLIVMGFFCFLSVLVHAEVRIQADSSQINFNESLRVTLTQDNLQTHSGIPNLTPLKKDFFIVSTERGINYSIINGQTYSSSTWTITLKPQKSGMLTIPAIQVGDEATTPLTIKVNANPTPKSTSDDIQSSKGIMLKTEVNDKKPYVNQQILYKVTLYNSKQLLDANYQGPKVENALLIPLDGGKRYQTQKNNVPYLVEEQNYAIFPQKSGPLKIISPVFTALVYDFNPQRVTTEDKTITLEVQPIPKEFTGKIWLPAKKVQLTEHYEQVTQPITQGNTLVRTVTLDGEGIPAQLLPNLNFAETDAFNVYPEKGKEKNRVSQGEVFSSVDIKATYLFNKSGTITIPELKLPWFNIQTGKEEFASLPAKTFKIMPASLNLSSADNSSEHLNQAKNIESPQDLKNTPLPTQSNWAWIVAVLFALAWLTTMLLWSRQKYSKNNLKNEYKSALTELHQACMQNQPKDARAALLKWASLHWPEASVLNLDDLIQRVTDNSLKKQIQILSQVLYKNSGTNSWCGNELWEHIQKIKRTNPQKTDRLNILPPINPT